LTYPALARFLIVAAAITEAASPQSQTFSSGSTGADGALNLTTPGTVYFDPKSFNPALNAAGDNTFNFTTINIASGVIVIFTSKILTGPMYWLASGAVTINGLLILDGEQGHKSTNFASERIPSAAGPGGFGGGIGGGGSLSSLQGNGPGGGAAATTRLGGNGTWTGNQYLVPLVGGSGGGGALNGFFCGGTTYGGGGGGGGGAILIASSTSIIIGTGGGILARGFGSLCDGGIGSGGAIRLVAPTVNSSGCCSTLDVSAGNGVVGRMRIEALKTNVNGSNTSINGPLAISVPFGLALPATPPASIKVAAINGVTINANPFTFPDSTINTNSPVTINVQAQYIPPGTVPKIYVFSESGPDQTITCTALAGTLQQSSCTASVTLVTGGSRGFVKAAW
jgi:hypothetical protein